MAHDLARDHERGARQRPGLQPLGQLDVHREQVVDQHRGLALKVERAGGQHAHQPGGGARARRHAEPVAAVGPQQHVGRVAAAGQLDDPRDGVEQLGQRPVLVEQVLDPPARLPPERRGRRGEDEAVLAVGHHPDRPAVLGRPVGAQVGDVDGDRPAVPVPHPGLAAPASQAERLGQRQGVRPVPAPDDQLLQRAAGDLLRRPAEQGLGVGVPRDDAALGVGDHHRDLQPVDGPAGRGQARGRRLRDVGELHAHPDPFGGPGVGDAPGVGQHAGQRQPASGGGQRIDERRRAAEHLPLRLVVVDLDLEFGRGGVRVQAAGQLDAGARVHDRVGDELTGQQHGVLGQMAQTPLAEHLADESACRGGGMGSAVEGGARLPGRIHCAS